MKKTVKKIVAVLLTVLIVISGVVSALALTPSYTPSTSYKSGQYYQNLTKVSLTGDQRADIVNVALSQDGYHEGNSSSTIAGGSTGAGNYTEYGYWYGNQGTAWCATFISWCAAQAGVPESIIPKTASTQAMYQALAHPSGALISYTPLPGDLAFICNNGGTTINHAGIVVSVTSSTITLIEGNYSDGVKSNRQYPRSSLRNGNMRIVGFGIPAYKSNIANIVFDANGGTGAPDLLTARIDAKTTLPTTVPVRENYTFVGWATTHDATAAQYTAGGEFTAKGDTKLFAVWKLKEFSVTYDANGGINAPVSQIKVFGQTVKITDAVPTRGGYTFIGWATTGNATAAQYTAGADYSTNENLKLYAVWQEIGVKQISIKKAPDKSEFYVDTLFDATGMEIEVVYDDDTVATVSTGYTVSADSVFEAEGKHTITVTYRGKTAELEVNVVAKPEDYVSVKSVSFKSKSVSLYSTSFANSVTVSPEDATNKKVIFSSSDESIATVDANGVISPVGIGEATITATTVDGAKKATCKVSVVSVSAGISIDADGGKNRLAAGDSLKLKAQLASGVSGQIVWTSSDEAVATVSADGTVTAVARGTAVITATVVGTNYSASYAISVTEIPNISDIIGQMFGDADYMEIIMKLIKLLGVLVEQFMKILEMFSSTPAA